MTVKEQDQIDFREGTWKCPESMLHCSSKRNTIAPKGVGRAAFHALHDKGFGTLKAGETLSESW